MDTTYRLQQTGEQVQNLLNQIPSLATELLTKYTKPVDGIPDTDLTAAIQQALALALTAYQKPGSGIPKTDLTTAVQNLLDAAGTAYQKPGSGIPKTDLATAVQNLLDAAGTAYQKPASGIPLTDLAASVQAAINASASMAQDIAAERLARETADLAINEALGTKLNQSQVESITAAALANYDTAAEVATAISTALASYYTKAQSYSKTEVDALVAPKQTQAQVEAIVSSALASYSTTSDVSAAIASALTDYYTKTVIDAALAGKQATLQFDQTPTLNSSNPVTSEGIRAAIAAAVNGLVNSTYVQNAITTALADYSTTAQVSTMISTAITTTLANYYTKDQVDGLVGGKYTKPSGGIPETDLASTLANKINGAATQANLNNTNDRVLFIERGLGKYESIRSITLQQATAGKYVNVNGQEVSASGYGISAEVQLNAGDIMLVPSASPVPADVSLFARIVTRTYDKVINYIYTYRQDYPELPATATADYNPALIYTAQYDESGDTPVLTGWLMGGQTYTALPATRTVTESYYEPLMKQAVAAMPSTGYYVYLCPTSMTIVVSGYTATVNGGVALVVGLGIFKNIATNFIGAPGQAVIAQAFAQAIGDMQGIIENLKHMGSFKATDIDCENMPKVCGYPLVVEGAGAPSIVPRFVGQRYHDTTNNKCYEAFAVTNSTANWVLLN